MLVHERMSKHPITITEDTPINEAMVDLIAMCTHGRTGLARWTLGSVADRVLHQQHPDLAGACRVREMSHV